MIGTASVRKSPSSSALADSSSSARRKGCNSGSCLATRLSSCLLRGSISKPGSGSPFGFFSTSFRDNDDQILTSCARKFDRFAANRIGGSAIKRTESTPILVNAIVFASNEPIDQGVRLGPPKILARVWRRIVRGKPKGRFSGGEPLRRDHLGHQSQKEHGFAFANSDRQWAEQHRVHPGREACLRRELLR